MEALYKEDEEGTNMASGRRRCRRCFFSFALRNAPEPRAGGGGGQGREITMQRTGGELNKRYRGLDQGGGGGDVE